MGTATNPCLIQTGQKEKTCLANAYVTLFTLSEIGIGICKLFWNMVCNISKFPY